MTKTPSTKVGKYQLAEIIGEGAMGTVYRATDPALHRDVAVKLMRKSFADDAHLRDRFEREARAAASLQHPNIVTIHDFGESKGHLYIVMEYVTGIDLAKLVKDGAPMSIHTRLNIVMGVLQGLSYAHDKGVVHRDIKPANIRMLEDERIKIMDFGIAHLTGSEITNSGVVLGTPDYMAPEQVEGLTVTPATDIFAVGAVLYELLCHQKPFQGDTVHAVLHKVVTADPAPLQYSDTTGSVPVELQSAIDRALAKDVKERFPSAQAMIEALEMARSALGAEDTKATLLLRPSSQKRRAVRRRWMWAGVAATGLAIVSAGAAVSIRPSRHAASGPARPESTRAVDSGAQAAQMEVAVRAVSESAFAPLRQAALEVRTRAGIAGARPATLAVGDSLAREAEGLAALGHQSEAVERLASATAKWQDAQATAAAAAARQKKKAATPVDPHTAADAIIQDLARAFDSRDVTAVRKVYTNLASDEQDRLVQFFQTNDSIKTSLRIESFDVQGRRANAIIRGSHDYLPLNAVSRKKDDAEYRAVFENSSSGWRLTMLRRGFFRK